MIFVTHQPCPALREFVDWFWFYEGYTPAHRLERLMPDGTFELCINLRDEVRHVYDRDKHQPVAAYRRAWLSGTHARHIVIDSTPDSSMMGVHFKPGGAAGVLGMPAGEMTDRGADCGIHLCSLAGLGCAKTNSRTPMSRATARRARLAEQRCSR